MISENQDAFEKGELNLRVEPDTSDQDMIDFRVRPVTRYVVTQAVLAPNGEFIDLPRQIGGESASFKAAYDIARALAEEAMRNRAKRSLSSEA